MKKYEISFFCNKCDKDIKGIINSDFDLNDEYLERGRKNLESQHKMSEHTYCFGCGKKVDYKNSDIQIIGKQDPDPEKEKGVAFTMLFGHFCENCSKQLQEKKEKEAS